MVRISVLDRLLPTRWKFTSRDCWRGLKQTMAEQSRVFLGCESYGCWPVCLESNFIISAVAVIRGLMFKKHGRLVITKIATTFLHLLLYLAFMVGITFCN